MEAVDALEPFSPDEIKSIASGQFFMATLRPCQPFIPVRRLYLVGRYVIHGWYLNPNLLAQFNLTSDQVMTPSASTNNKRMVFPTR
eukprot:scaffold3297_cov132-Cylindrotheca_fusiformis.AAC.7